MKGKRNSIIISHNFGNITFSLFNFPNIAFLPSGDCNAAALRDRI